MKARFMNTLKRGIFHMRKMAVFKAQIDQQSRLPSLAS
jgi:hypothetical protein